MTTKTDIRQLRSRDQLDQIAGVVDQQQDALMRATNSELTPPLRIVASATPDLTVTVESSVVTGPITGRNRTIPSIDGQDVAFSSGTVVLPASAGGTITVTPGTNQTLAMSASSFVKLGIYLQSDGNLHVEQGTEGASIAAAGSPGDLPNKYAIGYIIVETDGGSNVQVVDNGKIYQYVNAGVGGTDNQDRNIKMIGGGTWSWTAGAPGDLINSAAAYIQVPGLDDTSNEISAQTIQLDTNEVAYVDINRQDNTPTVLPVVVSNINAVPNTNNIVIVARRDGADIVVGTGSFRLTDGQSQPLDAGTSDQNLILLGSGVTESTSDPDYSTRGAANRTTANSEGFADAIANIDAEIDKFFGQLQIREHPSDSNRVVITPADQTMRDNTILSQEINNLLMKFDGAEIDFSTGEIFEDDGTTPLGVDFTPAVISAGEYFWYSITAIPAAVNADNTIGLQFTVIGASASGATSDLAAKPAWSNGKKLGMVVVQESGGGIAAITQDAIRQLGVGSGSGGSNEVIEVDLYDDVVQDLTDPVLPDFKIDDVAPTIGTEVLFSNLNSDHNQIYSLDSIDPVNWSAQSATEANLWQSVTWSPELGLFVAVSVTGTNRVMTSPDGVNWSAHSATENNTWYSVTWSPELGLFVAVSTGGTNQVMTSPDGVNWSAHSAAESNAWTSVTWSPELGLFVAVSITGANRVMTSPDGVNWSAQSAAESNQWRSVTWSPELGLLVAVADTGTNRVMTSPDGVNWSAQSAADNNTWYSVTWSPELGLFVAVAYSGTNQVMTSPDGVNWSAQSAAESNAWRSVIWSPELGLLVAVASNGANRVMTNSGLMQLTWSPKAAFSNSSVIPSIGDVISISSGVKYGGNLATFNGTKFLHQVAAFNIDVSSPEDGNALVYDSSTDTWKPGHGAGAVYEEVIGNNISTPTNLVDFIVDSTENRAFTAEYSIVRGSGLGSEKIQQGTLRGLNRTSTGWELVGHTTVGDDAGVSFTIDSSTGQVKYTSSNTDSGIIKYTITKL